MMPKAVPAAPLGLWAKQCYADADVEAAAAIVAPTNIATRKRLMICPPIFMHARSRPAARLDAGKPIIEQNTSPLLLGNNVWARQRRKYYSRRFFVRHPFPDPDNCDHRSEARAKAWLGKHCGKRTPSAVLAPGVPELSLILGSRPYGGVSGDGVPYSQRTNGSNTSVGGWGCRTLRLTYKVRTGA